MMEFSAPVAEGLGVESILLFELEVEVDDVLEVEV